MTLHVGRAVSHNRITDRVRLIERIAGEIKDLIVDRVRDFLGNAVRKRARNVPFGIPADESNSLGVDDRVLLL